VIRKRLSRLGIVLTSAALAAMLFGTGAVSAANPTWRVTFDSIPNVVSPGADAGWLVTVINDGPSQINDLNVTIDSTSTTAGYVYLSDIEVSTGFVVAPCPTLAGVTTCNVGTLPDDGTASFTVAFPGPSSTNGSFNITIGLRSGTGDTETDPGHSRGDKKTFTSSTPIVQNDNFDGGFTFDDFTYQTNQNVGRRNIQATTVDNVGDSIGVTVSDGGYESDPTCPVQPACTNVIGEWSNINVDDGAPQSAFRVTLLVSGSTVPNGTDVEDIVLIHVLDFDGPDAGTDNDVVIIGDDLPGNEHCASEDDSDSAECIFVTKVGSNFRIVAWLFENGGLRGGY
jgi:hypothetical protein